MKHFFCLAVVGSAFFAIGPLAHAQDREGRDRKHHKVREWLALLSTEERAKLSAAKNQAMKDPTIKAANQRRKQADSEYRELLRKEILKSDPSLKPLLDKINDLRKHDDY